MSSHGPYARFSGLRFDDFQRMARDESLTSNERSGFPESYRDGADGAILADIVAKLPALGGDRRRSSISAVARRRSRWR